MKVLLWTRTPTLADRVTPHISATGAIIFHLTKITDIFSTAREVQPLLVVLGPEEQPEALKDLVEQLLGHPDTRWTSVVLLTDGADDLTNYGALLDRGATYLVDASIDPKLLQAQFRALYRSALRVTTLHSTRLTDEQTGFYHHSFMLDQLQVLCRKVRRDGDRFCLLFLELKGEESEVQKAALALSNTVRGADLFGRWDQKLFAVLLPSSLPSQAHLLAERCKRILNESSVEARAALISSDSEVVEAEALVEVALNSLDEAWSDDAFLWTWDQIAQQAQLVKLPD